jgi:hypothetical protein
MTSGKLVKAGTLGQRDKKDSFKMIAQWNKEQDTKYHALHGML